MPTDEGESMSLDKGKTQERADGWYWVRWIASNSEWRVSEYGNGKWWRFQYSELPTEPFEIGPRIPSPDEPAREIPAGTMHSYGMTIDRLPDPGSGMYTPMPSAPPAVYASVIARVQPLETGPALSPDEPAAVAPPNSQFQDHVKHVQEFLQQMFAIMIDPVEDATGTVADTCRLLLNAARRDRETINHLMSPKVAPPTRPAGLDVEALLELCEKATPGPWTTHKMEGHTAVAANTLIARVFSTAFKDLENERVNAHLISAARTALPLALQHILALEREIARLRADGERR